MGPEGTEFKYQWQATNDKGEWVNLTSNASGKTYTVADGLYDKKYV